MQAFVYHRYGSPDVLELETVAQPHLQDDEVLVQVMALSINPAEWHLMRASIWMIRTVTGLTKPKKPILRADLAGCVVAVGKTVSNFQVGDYVFGRSYEGGLAEYACLKANQAVQIPQNISIESAAATPLASLTALIALRDKGQVKTGEKILINGASGGIGTFAVQLANYYGAEVTGVCSASNTELIHKLGAQHVIDYTIEDFTEGKQKFDIVIDLIGNHPISALKKVLKPKGRCVLVGYTNASNTLGFMFKGMWYSLMGKQKFASMNTEIKKEDLEFIAKLIGHGHVKPVIERVYQFKDLPNAFKYLGSRRAKGKLVVKLNLL